MELNGIAIIITVAVYLIVLIKMRRNVTTFRDYILLPITAAMGFTVYFIGYLNLDTHGIIANVLLALFSTVEMVVMKADLGGVAECCQKSEIYMVFFEVAHSLAVLLVATTALSIWGKKLITRMTLRSYRTRRSYIFFDVNEESMTLAEDLLKNGSKRVVVFVNEDESKTDEIEKLKAYYVNPAKSRNEIGGKSLLTNIISSNSDLFYISTDESHNINRALNMLALLKKLPEDKLQKATKNIDMHIRIGSEDMQQIFEEARKLQGVNINFSVFNEAEIISTQFIREYPPVKYIKPDTEKAAATTDYEVMVIGFGKRGRAILRKTIEFGQFVGSTYRATVVDMAIKQKIGSFNANYPALSKEYNIVAVEDYASSDTFFELLRERSATLKQIVISLKNDTENMKRAIEIYNTLASLGRTDIDIIVVTRSVEGYDYMHKSDNFGSIHCVGRTADIYTEAIIVNDSLFAQAKRVHSYYDNKKHCKKQVAWRNLSSLKQQSNVSVSEHIPTKMALMGLSEEGLHKFKTNEEYKGFVSGNTERYDNLARTEHLRWNAFHYARGWQQWQLCPENGAGKSSGDENRKLHICLVEWDALAPLDTHQGQAVGTYQGYDYDNSDNIWETLNIL